LSEPAFEELLRRLVEADVEFIVVGGLAVNAWGVVRGTKDVDVVVAPEIENLKRVVEVAVASRRTRSARRMPARQRDRLHPRGEWRTGRNRNRPRSTCGGQLPIPALPPTAR
jgi:hypothetical protein